jgi:transcriptional regulator NrdR family protein
MYCPKCASTNTTVKSTKKGLITNRYRVCKDCSFDFMTFEAPKANLFMEEYLKYLKDNGELSLLQTKLAMMV